jgi:AraC-like DNA-binding protein
MLVAVNTGSASNRVDSLIKGRATMSTSTPLSHHIKGVVPALEVMQSKGFTAQDCLKGTGVLLSQLNDADRRISFQQELTFYRNILELARNPLIGLELGRVYLPQRYGIYGYALLSAPTLRHALRFATHFSQLTFSFFSMEFVVVGKAAKFSFRNSIAMEPELLHLFCDRELAATEAACSAIMGRSVAIERVQLLHDGRNRKQAYREFFGCEPEFLAPGIALEFSSSIVDSALPQSDAESSRYFHQQCQMLIAKMSSQSSFVDDVRQLVLARPGYFPDIEVVAEKLQMSTRTLRRRLKGENSSFQSIVNEVRYSLARQYLLETQLPMESISELLGYSEPGNFSHAFKRWSTISPTVYRRQQAE